MATKEQILDVIHYGHDQILRFVERLSETDRATIGEDDQWTVRDVLSHVIESMHQGVGRLSNDVRGIEQEPYGDFNVRNANMVADYRGKSWDEVYAALQAAFPATEALLGLLTEEELNDPGRIERLQGQPIWRSIVGNVLTHPLAFHIRPWYIAQGEVEPAIQQAEEEAHMLLALADPPGWQGNVLYNLACTYAICGQQAAALERLEKALQLAPAFAEYAKQDSDFDSLKGKPEFVALLANQTSPG